MRVLSYSQFFPYPDFPIRVMPVERHTSNTLHGHEFTELVVVTRGRAAHVTASGSCEVGEGDAMIIHEGALHRYEADSDFGLVNVLFAQKGLPIPVLDSFMLPGHSMLFGDKSPGKIIMFRLPPPHLERVLDIVGELGRELTDRPPGYQYASISLFMRLVVHLSRFVLGDASAEEEAQARAGGLMRFLNENYAEDFSLEEMCAKAGMSPSSLIRHFKRTVGCTPVEYLIRLRISNAMQMLRTTGLTIREIGLRSGFSDGNYFARQFRKVAGVSPSSYRSSSGAR